MKRTFEKNGLTYTVEYVDDTDPDLSYLGEFTNTWSVGCIEHSNGGREFRYFKPAMSGEESGNPDSPQQDYERMKDYGNGWSMVGVVVTIEAWVPIKGLKGHRRRHAVGRASVWGIESDSDESCFKEIEEDLIFEVESSIQDLRRFLRPANRP